MLNEQGPTVLLVEDEDLLHELIAEALRDLGMTVIEAANADAATEFLQEGVLANFLVTDVHMPGSVNGLELARRVKVNYPAIGILVTSSDPNLARGPFEFIQKPCEHFRGCRAHKKPFDALGSEKRWDPLGVPR